MFYSYGDFKNRLDVLYKGHAQSLEKFNQGMKNSIPSPFKPKPYMDDAGWKQECQAHSGKYSHQRWTLQSIVNILP